MSDKAPPAGEMLQGTLDMLIFRTLVMGLRAGLEYPQHGYLSRNGLGANWGAAIGIGGAFWLTRFIAGLLFGVKAWDAAVFVTTLVLLSIVALIAVWILDRRATRVDPMTALRFE
jgi:hypothetical protein